MNLRDELEAIRAEHGMLTAEIVVAAAEPEDHPLHHRFTWDDAEAGPRWRLEQARVLISEVRVTYIGDNDQPSSVRRYHSINYGEGQTVYQPLDEILDDPTARRLLVKQMERDWKAFQSRYEHLQEFEKLVRAQARKVSRRKT